MAEHRVLCKTEHPHITSIGTGEKPSMADKKSKVSEVVAAMEKGTDFYVESPDGKRAYLTKVECECGAVHIRTTPDATKDNNLDSLRECAWKKN